MFSLYFVSLIIESKLWVKIKIGENVSYFNLNKILCVFNNFFKDNDFSESELKLMTIQDIIKELLRSVTEGEDVNLTRLKCDVSQKYGLHSQPRLVDIISCIPPEHKPLLLPKLKAKPIRTASGIAVVAVMCKPHRCPHINMTGNICVKLNQIIIKLY